MILAWMASASIVAALCGLAALAVEPVVRGIGAGTRWVWAAALAVSLALPAIAWVAPPTAEAVAGAAAGVSPADLGALLRQVGEAAPPLLARLDTPARMAWLGASALLFVALTAGLGRLLARARGWPTARVDGDEVLVSEDFGPAAFGVRAARIVLPRWALDLEPTQLRLVVAHEREHGRAGDARLLLAGALALVAAPWNAALWWQLARLRAAVEIDCDRRVVQAGAPAGAYGRLLLELGTRTRRAPLPVPGLARPRSLLERRMTMIVRGARRTGAVATLAGAVGAGLLLVAACETPMPTAVQPRSEEPVAGTVRFSPAGEKLQRITAGEDGLAPVVFVDGERVEGVPSTLAPEEIERIEVVKGGAARAILGDEAAGGVIQITTKAGGGATNGAEAEKGGTYRLRKIAPDGAEKPASAAGQLEAKLRPVNGDEPRVYVDGTLFEGDLSEISPDAVERIDVIKKPDGGEPGEIRITLKKPNR